MFRVLRFWMIWTLYSIPAKMAANLNTDSLYTVPMAYTPLHQMCGGFFKQRALLVRTHTAGQSIFCSNDLFCPAVKLAVTLPI